MIYLIDDNQDDQMSSRYKIDIIVALKQWEQEMTWLNNIAEINEGNLLKEATGIFIHSSVSDPTKIQTFISEAQTQSIPYCIFSNGATNTEWNVDDISIMNKDRFYNNLPAFMKHYQETGEFDLQILLLGTAYSLEKAYIIQDKLIASALLMNSRDFTYEKAFQQNQKAHADLKKLFLLSNPNSDFLIFESRCTITGFTAQQMRIEIDKLVKQVKKQHE